MFYKYSNVPSQLLHGLYAIVSCFADEETATDLIAGGNVKSAFAWAIGC